MVKAKIIWFDRKKGIGEALDESGRTLFISALEVIPAAKPMKLSPNEDISCHVKKSKTGYVAQQITRPIKTIKKRIPPDAAL